MSFFTFSYKSMRKAIGLADVCLGLLVASSSVVLWAMGIAMLWIALFAVITLVGWTCIRYCTASGNPVSKVETVLPLNVAKEQKEGASNLKTPLSKKAVSPKYVSAETPRPVGYDLFSEEAYLQGYKQAEKYACSESPEKSIVAHYNTEDVKGNIKHVMVGSPARPYYLKRVIGLPRERIDEVGRFARQYGDKGAWHHVTFDLGRSHFDYMLTREVPGQTLKDFLMKYEQNHGGVSLGLKSACRLFLSVARQVEAMHGYGFCHGDLHLKNLVVDKDRVRAIDFGMAYPLVDEGYPNTISAHPITWCPEMLAGTPKDGVGQLWNKGWSWVNEAPTIASNDEKVKLKSSQYGRLTDKSDVWSLWCSFRALLGGDIDHQDERFDSSATKTERSVFVKEGLDLSKLKAALKGESRVSGWDGFLGANNRPCEGLSCILRNSLKQLLRLFCETKLLNNDPEKRPSAKEVAGCMEGVVNFLNNPDEGRIPDLEKSLGLGLS